MAWMGEKIISNIAIWQIVFFPFYTPAATGGTRLLCSYVREKHLNIAVIVTFFSQLLPDLPVLCII
jgi:hypothetical protein